MVASVIRLVNLGPFRHQSSRPSATDEIDLRFGARAVAAPNTIVEAGGLYPAGIGSLVGGAGKIRKPPAFSPPQLVAILDMRFMGAGKPGVSAGDPIDFSFARGEEAGPEQEIFAASFPSSEWGLGRVWLAEQYVKVIAGLSPGAFGGLFFELSKRYMHPATFTSSQVGRPAPVYNRDRFIYARAGFSTHAVSKPAVTAEVRRIYVSSFDASAFGKPAAALAKRPIVVSGFSSAGVGLAWASFHTRWISGAGNIKLVNYWSNTNVVSHKNRYIQAVGAPSKQVLGTLLIRDALSDMTVPGIAGFGSGTARVEYVRRHVVPDSWVSSGYGMAWPINRNRLVLAASVNDWRVGVGTDVYHYEGQLSRVGLGIQTAFGITNVHQWMRYVQPHGWDNNPIHRRRPTIYNSLEKIQHFASRITTEFGETRFELFIRHISPQTIPARGNGLSTVHVPMAQLARRYVYPATIYVSVVSSDFKIADRAFYPQAKGFLSYRTGSADVGHEVRRIVARGFAPTVFGRPRGYTKIASIYPSFIFSFGSGVAWVADGERVVRPGGIASDERVAGGMTFVARSIRALIVQGINSEAFSLYAVVKDARMFVAPFSLPVSSQVYGGAVELWVRTVVVGRWQDTQEPTTRYGLTTVGLGDRTLWPSSVNQWRIGVGVTVHQFVADIDSVSGGLQLRFGATLISHGIRYLGVEGLPPSGFGRYKRVHNAAFAITHVTLAEIQKHSFLAQVRNKNRYFAVPSITMVDSESVFGSVFIADRVRAFMPFGIRSTQYVPQTHWVSYLHRRLVVGGIVAPDISGKREMEVYERFNIIRTFWMYVRNTTWGYAVVANRNRSVRPYGYDYAEFGQTVFEHFIRTVYVGVTQVPGMPRPRIADRKQSVDMARFSLAYSVVNKGARVRNLLPDPPWSREINIPSIFKPQDEFGVVRFKLMTVAGAGVEVSSSVGEPVLTRNTIEVRTGIVNYDWGMTTVAGPIYLNIRTISTPVGNQVPEGARLTPFNIYAPKGEERPYGYRPTQPYYPHVIDGMKYYIPGTSTYDATKDRGGWVPRPRVEYRHRVVETRGHIDSRVNTSHRARLAYIPITSQYITLTGWRQSRVGWVMLLPFTIEARGRGFDASAFGKPSLIELPVWEREVKPKGFNVRRFGDAWVDYYNRYLGTKGRDTSVYGRPTIWFRVRSVQLRSGIVPTNKISELNWVSNYIRTVEARGWSAFNPQTAFEEFETSVVNQYTGDVINAQSLVPGAVGLADVDRYTKYVLPRGLFPVPPLRPAVKSRTTLQAQGAESLVFGQVRKFEEGVLYPHELEVGVVGVAHVSTPRQVQGFDSSMVNYPTIAAHAGATGVKSEEFGITILKNEICCGGCE